jgi:YggT family protein
MRHLLPSSHLPVKRNAAETIALSGAEGYLCHNLLWLETPMTSLFQILLLILDIAKWIILAHIIMSWLINFQVLNLRQPVVAQIWAALNKLLYPVYSKVRSFIPAMAGLDLAPLVVLLLVYGLRIILVNNVAAFY